jgi:hypothetical protein
MRMRLHGSRAWGRGGPCWPGRRPPRAPSLIHVRPGTVATRATRLRGEGWEGRAAVRRLRTYSESKQRSFLRSEERHRPIGHTHQRTEIPAGRAQPTPTHRGPPVDSAGRVEPEDEAALRFLDQCRPPPNLIVPGSVRAQTQRGPAVWRGLVVEQLAAMVTTGARRKQPLRLSRANARHPPRPSCEREHREGCWKLGARGKAPAERRGPASSEHREPSTAPKSHCSAADLGSGALGEVAWLGRDVVGRRLPATPIPERG